jgi:hypothetical protein
VVTLSCFFILEIAYSGHPVFYEKKFQLNKLFCYEGIKNATLVLILLELLHKRPGEHELGPSNKNNPSFYLFYWACSLDPDTNLDQLTR